MTAYLARVRAAFAAALTRDWWAEVAEASIRQAQHIAIPFLLVVISTGRVDLALATGLLLQLAGGEIVVITRRLAALTVPDTSDLVTRVIARGLAAFAGAIAGYVLTVPIAGVLSLEWPTILVSAIGSTVLALVHGGLDPAATDVIAGDDVILGEHRDG
ncbi:hypothetical protein [Kineosporia sp. R_H_3]|uniref:hypothetical protein n=1 Tax=Kineosporia sp. R_H_3 TaxID=1961848 RepID=UPI000B4B4EB6|nr:hypothetical protein [Kineosporia sp. R_H_3]